MSDSNDLRQREGEQRGQALPVTLSAFYQVRSLIQGEWPLQSQVERGIFLLSLSLYNIELYELKWLAGAIHTHLPIAQAMMLMSLGRASLFYTAAACMHF